MNTLFIIIVELQISSMQTAIYTTIYYAQVQGFMHISSELVFIVLSALIIGAIGLLLFILLDIRDRIAGLDLLNVPDGMLKEQSFDANCKQFYLTSREIEILKHIWTGKPYKIIAAELNISEKTVKNHVRNMYEKTGVSNKMELVSRMSLTN